MTHRISIVTTQAGPSRSECIGSVQDVIAGRIAPHLEKKRFDAHAYRYGFLLGSPKNRTSLGETILVNNQCYTTSTDATSPEYNTTIYGPTFMTSGLFVLPLQARPSHTVTLDTDQEPMDITAFFNEMYRLINRPLACVGLVEFAQLHGTAVGKPPIDGRNFFDFYQEYHPFPPTLSANTHACIMGALTNFGQTDYATINKELESVLYKTSSPGDPNGEDICSHVHALTLKSRVSATADITPQSADRVVHVLEDKTIIASAHLDVYVLDHITKI